jgi:hypothetical protein
MESFLSTEYFHAIRVVILRVKRILRDHEVSGGCYCYGRRLCNPCVGLVMGRRRLSELAVILGGMSSDVLPRLLDLARLQAGVVSRRQAIGVGMTTSAVTSKVAHGRWRNMHPGVYATFTGPAGRSALLWAAVLHAGKGAHLSHETAAELLRLTGERCPLIHLTIPAERHISQREGIVIHRSSHMAPGWRFARGVPPHTMVEETILDLLDAAAHFDDAVGWITRAFQRNLTNEGNLRRAMDARKRLRWRARLDEVIPMAASGTDSTLEYRTTRMSSVPTPCRQRTSRFHSSNRMARGDFATAITTGTAFSSSLTAGDITTIVAAMTGAVTTPLPRPREPRSATAGMTSRARHAKRPPRYTSHCVSAATPERSNRAHRPAPHSLRPPGLLRSYQGRSRR